ncbi:family 20 glycosylhydrolase [Vibrio sp. V31_P5A7T61]|uniref:beta-N-acetylhexosaminidase n=1 Tax=unclassified Vibrio TaxID=2614977 RepID=UPI001372F24D|nr:MULTISPECIES: beta-N-acetylhexosaminidase [unclassified Vibrio]NAW62074.1 family 20 glycosylhydrolase [Vibrio sp. V31_P5A7T61]NAX00558.1 family 20 glycosylhydrolase [Vibrio sp. V34_P3A8T189]NAX07553.1 family 20 glycosylhydrolase [Vibrio sp. V40_P2S30T141]NAX63060.1 family 20 glycosylhydrolase [Vibrio sp. V32_P6A28T40]
MNKGTLVLLISGLITIPTAAMAMTPNTDLNLMPYPQNVELGQGKISLDKSFSIYIKGYDSPRVQFNIKRTMERLYRQTGLPMLNWYAESEKDATLVIDIRNAPKSEVQDINSDESYQLESRNGQIIIRSEGPYGAFHGLETFLQLVTTDTTGYFVPAVSIQDEPRFPWRGVSYDTSRHFIELDVILRQLDAMASAKMNVFHWHMWDDQAIRIQLDNYQKLWQDTADGDYYTKDEIRYVVNYARNLGIRVIPEISLPGHASAVAHAYPELMSGMAEQSYPHQRGWGVFEPLMDPTNPELYKMLASVFDEVVELFPDEYFHIGGDEPNYQQWKDNPKIQQFIKDNNLDGERGLQSYLNTKVEQMLEARGKKMTGWDEIWHKDLPTSIVIQSWQGHDSIGRAAKEGYQGILSTGYYLDQPQPTSYHYRNDPIPKGITVDDQLYQDEKFATYDWVKPRNKGGPRIGNLTIIKAADGSYRAFTDYNGKSREEVFIIEYLPGVKFRGHFDNFMSYTEFNYDFADGKLKDSSYQLIGNVRWPTTGELVASSDMEGSIIPEPNGGYPAELTEKEQQLILGGEITIWGENLDSMTIEQRLWPRSYAIAERLWSSQDLTDERSMYRRMKVIDTWSEISLGLRHHADANMMLKRLANGADETPLQTLAKYIEPAQYYARHWEKWISTPNEGDLYNQYERLNRFADALPVESLAVYEMQDLVVAYAQGDITALDALAMHYQNIKLAAQQAKPIFAANVASVETVPVAEAAIKVADLGLTLIKLAKQGCGMGQSDAEAYQRIINENAIIFDETIVAIVVPTEQLLHTLTD